MWFIKKFMKIISVMLIITMLLSMAVSCGKNNVGDDKNNPDTPANNNADNGGAGGQPDNNNNGSDTGDIPQDTKTDVRDILATLPDADYGGYQFRIWTSNNFNSTLEGRQAPDLNDAGEIYETGDIVNDALYRRDRLVEEKYNIEIKYTIYPEPDPVYNAAKKTIDAGDDGFDYAMDAMMNLVKPLAQSGKLIDFNKIPNIDLSKEWWSKYAIRDLTIDGKFFFATGDITARYPGSQYLMLFNKSLFLDMGLSYPYQSVLDGNWTLDALFELTKGSTRDLNGDGTLKKADDFFGLVVETMAPICFLRSAGEGLTKIVDGNPVFNVTNERTVAIMQKLASSWTDPQYVYYPSSYATYDEVPIFKENRALFVAMTGTNTVLFKDMESDFGIIPLPKYDASQPEYYTHCQPWGSAAVCVPVTCTNLDRTGMIIEAMAAGGRYTSTPAAYEITLKTKYARDEESEKMLDIICEGSSYDFAHIYDWGGIYTQLCNVIAKGDSFASKFESIEGKAQAAMEKTIEAFVGAE